MQLTHGRLCAHAASLMLLLLLEGCTSLPSAKKPADPRIVKSCTDIRNLTEKNYKLGAKFNYILVGLGFDFERSGIKLSNEAAQHQIEMDRLCKQRAAGDITEETWVKMVTAYAAASVAAAVRSNDPEVMEELQANLEAMKTELQRLAQLSPQESSTTGPSFELDVANVIADAREASDSAISAKLASLSETLDGKMQLSSTELREQVEKALALKEFQLLNTISALEKRVTSLEPKPLETPAWQMRPAFRVKFEHGSWELSDTSKVDLRTALETLGKALDYRIELFGYTDTSGSPAANAALSIARAQEARDFLMDVLQLEPSKILVVGRRHGAIKFGPPAENRVVEVRLFVLDMPAASLAIGTPSR